MKNTSRFLVILVTFALLCVAGSARADVFKADNTTALNDPASWMGGVVPTSSDVAVWDSTVTTANNAPLGADTNWAGIKILNPGGLVTIGTGANILTLGTGGIDLSLATQDLYLNGASLDVGANSQAWNLGSRYLRLGAAGLAGALSGSGTITIAGSGLVDLNPTAVGASNFSGKWIVEPGATLRTTRHSQSGDWDAFGSNTSSDAIALNGGTLAVGGFSGSGAQGNWTWANPITLAAGTTSFLDNQIPSGTGRSLNLNGAISGTGNLEYRNTSDVNDTSFSFNPGISNTYSGTTLINGGPRTLRVQPALGTVAGLKTPFGSGAVTVTNATLRYGAGSTSALMTNNNLINLFGNSTLTSADGVQTFLGNIILNGTNKIQSVWNNKNALFNGTISDGTPVGGLVISSENNSDAQVILNANNTYSGGTSITNGRAVVTSANGLGSGLVELPIAAGRLFFTPATAGATTTISALRTRRDVLLGNNVLLDVTSGNVGFNTAGGFWIQPVATSDTGRLTSSSGTLSLSSVDANGVITTGNLTTLDHQNRVGIADYGATPVAVVKNGANSLQLNQLNTFTGGLTINGGRLNANHANAMGLGTVTVNNGGQAYLNLTGATYTNNITLNGIGVTEAEGNLGALRFGSSGQTYSGTVTAATATRIHAQNGDAILSGPLVGSVNVEKTGSSQITFSSANPSFTGTLIGAGGPLNLAGSIAGNLSVTDAGTILGEGTVGGFVTLGSIAGAVIRVQGNTPGALTAAGGLTLNGVSTISVDSVPAVPGPFPVINYGGTLVGGLANLTVAGLSAFRTPPVLADTGSAITLTLQNGLGLTWTGANGTAWDLNTTTNWTDGVNEQAFMQMDSVTFDDTSANGTVDMTGLLQPSSVTFSNSTTEYVVNGLAGNGIVGPASIAKSGTVAVTLGGANDFTGPITVNAGVLKMGAATAFGRSSGISISAGAQVDINGQTPGTLATGGYTYTIAGTGDGNGAIVNSGADAGTSAGVKSMELADNASIGGNGGRFDIGNANLAGFGTLTGNGKTLTKVGSCSMGFRGEAAATPINIVADGGVIWAENTDNAFGGTTGTLTINNGAKAGTYGPRTIATPVTINAGGTLHNQGGDVGTWTGTITANDGAIFEAATEVRIAGTLNAGGSIDKTGASQVTILGTAAIAGDLDVQDGIFQVGNLGTAGTIGNPGSITISRNSDGNPGLSYRLGGADATLSSPVVFNAEYAELRHHPAYPTNKLTLTGTVGNSQFSGVLDVETGTMALGGAASATVNTVRIKGTPNDTDRGIVAIPASASLTTRYLNMGAGGNQSGIINQSGGTVTLVDGSAGMRVGHWNNNSSIYGSEYNLTGGTLDATGLLNNIAGTEGEKVINVGWDGYGVVNVGGGAGTATLKAVGLRYDRNRASSSYPSMMSVNPNGVVEVGSLGIVGQGVTKTFLNAGKLIGTAGSLWTAPMVLADSTTGTIEVNSDVVVTNTGAVSGGGALNKTGAGALVLAGINTYAGVTTVSEGTLAVLTGGSCSNSVVTFAGGTACALYLGSAGGQWACGGLTFGTGTTELGFNFGAFPPSTTIAPLQVNGNLAINGTLNVRVSGNVSTVGTYPLVKYTGTLSGTVPTTPASLPTGLVAVLVNNTANKSIDLQVTVGNVLTWADGNGAWDIATSLNWKNAGGTIVTYADGQAVQFDDTASGASPILVTLDTMVNPGMVTVANAAKDYSISGSGSIAGFAALAKKGAAKLTLAGTHTYSSGTIVSEGTLQLGDDTANNGFVAGAIVNDATLVFANPLDQVNAVAIAGTGAVVKASSGTLTFSTRQTYTGGTTINGGVLDLTAGGGAGGTIRGTATVNTGGTLRLSTGDATGYALTDRIDPINLNGGTMDVNIGAASAGTAAWNQTLGGATVNMTGGAITGMSDGNIDFFQGSSTLNTFASATPSTISGVPISPLRQGNTTFTVEDGAAEIDLDITSVIRASPSGDAAGAVLIKAGAGTMRLGAINTFERDVQVDAGTVQLDGSLAVGANVTVNAGGILSGIGSIYGDATANSGGTLSPGVGGIGILSIYGALTLGAGSTTAADVDATSLTCDLVQYCASVSFGGNLVVTNHSGTPTIGQTFQLFATPGTGNFSSITPPPGTGLAWHFDPATGMLSVVEGPATTPTNVTAVVVGSDLEVSWPADYTGWQLQVQDNPLNVGLSDNWSAWEGSTTTNRVFVPILQSNPSVFLRLVYPPLP